MVVVTVCRGDGGDDGGEMMLCLVGWSSPGLLTGSASFAGAGTRPAQKST